MKQLNISLDAQGFGQVVCDGAPLGKVRALRIDTKAGQPTRVVVEHIQPELGVVFRGPATLEVLPPATELGTDKNGRRLMCIQVQGRPGLEDRERMAAYLKDLGDRYQIDFLLLDAGAQLVDPLAVEVVPINGALLPKPEPDLHAIVEEVFHRLQIRTSMNVNPFAARLPNMASSLAPQPAAAPAVEEAKPTDKA